MHLYAGDMNLNRKDEKKVFGNTNISFFRKQNDEKLFFLV